MHCVYINVTTKFVGGMFSLRNYEKWGYEIKILICYTRDVLSI